MKSAARNSRATWNPLACSDTPMRPNTLLMAKLSWLLLLAGGFWRTLQAPVIPGIGLLANIPGGTAWLAVAFWLGGACLLCNRAVRGACAILGGTVLLVPFESLTAWHPYAWVCGGVLLLCALQVPADEPRFVRWFVVLVHGAAALTAIDGAGWIGNALAEPWSESDFIGTVPRWLTHFVAADTLARGMYWSSAVICSVIPIGLLVARTQRTTAALAVFFYVALYVALGSTGVVLFGGAIAVAQISCLSWPRFVLVIWPRACGWPLALRAALDRYDFERRTDWPRPPDPDAELEAWFDLRPVAGAKAIVEVLLCFPVFYFALLAAITAMHALLPRFIAVSIISTLVLGLLGFSAFAALSKLYAWIRKRPPPPLPEPAAGIANDLAGVTPMPAAEPAASTGGSDVTNVTIEIDTPPPPDR